MSSLLNGMNFFGSGMGGGVNSLFGGMSPGLGSIAGGVMQGWQGVAATAFATNQGTAQNAAIAKTQQEAMQKQALIKLVTDMIEGACKMIKACGEAIKGLC